MKYFILILCMAYNGYMGYSKLITYDTMYIVGSILGMAMYVLAFYGPEKEKEQEYKSNNK